MAKGQDKVNSGGLQVEYYDTAFGTVPIYKDSTLDWYQRLAAGFSDDSRKRALSSSLLYFGPYLAESWVRRSRTKTAPGNMLAEFETAVSRLILPNLSKHDVTLIDLGVGEFSKGSIILNQLLRNPARRINYVLHDVSYDMIASVLRSHITAFMTTLGAVHRLGKIIAINADFYELDHYQNLLPSSGQKCLGLFGNTLGTQDHPERLLDCIRNVMCDGDVFMAELQLLEPDPPTDLELLERFAVTKDFYAGPFLALGYPDSELKLEARTEYFDRYAAVNIICKVMKTRTIKIQAPRNLEITIPEGEYCTLTICKYQPEAIAQLFNQSGLEIVDYYRTPSLDPRHRIFAHVAARKCPLPLEVSE